MSIPVQHFIDDEARLELRSMRLLVSALTNDLLSARQRLITVEADTMGLKEQCLILQHKLWVRTVVGASALVAVAAVALMLGLR